MSTYADTRWPWRIKVTRTDGTFTVEDYGSEFDPVDFAKWASAKPGIERVELSVTFVNGEAVAAVAAGETGTA
jgi:hypothetical protein